MIMARNVFIIFCCIFFFSMTAFAQQKDAVSEKAESPSVKTESGSEPAIPGDTESAEEQETVEMTDIHDIKLLENIGVDLTLLYYALGAVLILALLFAVFFYLKKRKKRIKEKTIVTLSPDKAAFALLDELTDVEIIDGKEFYFRLSAILRAYIEGRYSINAPEMTTEEFLPRIKELKLDKELQQNLRKLFHSTDPVKFAGSLPVENKMEKDLFFVRSFVKQTTEQLAVSSEVKEKR